MQYIRIFLFCAAMIVMGCCNFIDGKNPSGIVPCADGITVDSLIEMSKKPYMVPYVKYLMKDIIAVKDKNLWSYTLAYIDDDEIPEMIVRCNKCYPIPIFVLAQHDGIVGSIEARHEVVYNESEGLLIINTGGQIESTSRVFKLKNGKFEMTAVKKEFWADDIDYYFNDAKVDQETAERLLEEAFEYKEASINIEDLEWRDWIELLNHKESISGWK